MGKKGSVAKAKPGAAVTSRNKSGVRTAKKAAEPSPLIGWLEKPRMLIRRGSAARQAREEQAGQTPSFWRIAVQLLPIWVLVILVLILAPELPFRAAGAVVDWIGSLRVPQTTRQVEPVFIVEGADVALPAAELPEPNWDPGISPAFTPEVQYWAGEVAEWSQTYRIRPNLIATLIQIESCGNPDAESEAGAVGLFQVMPLHFEAGENPFDPQTNARRGLTFFAGMYTAANGDVGLSFAAYNSGPSVFTTSPSEWPLETQYYQFWGSGIYEEMERGFQESPTLLEWLTAGGSDLCRQAAQALGLN